MVDADVVFGLLYLPLHRHNFVSQINTLFRVILDSHLVLACCALLEGER